jgi:hypothetical protein
MPRSVKKSHLRHIRKVARIELPDELVAEIDAIVMKALSAKRTSQGKRGQAPVEQSDAELFKTSFAPVIVQQAITNFIGNNEYAIPPPVFRKLVAPKSRLVKALDSLIKRLPTDGEPPIEQMRALFCFGDAELDGLDAENEKLEAVWDNKYSSSVIRAALQQWLDLLGRLHRQVGKGAPPNTAQLEFVEELAAFWTGTIGAVLGSSRNENSPKPGGGNVGETGQRGLFAQFVHAAAKGIPKEFLKQGRLSWDHTIREISEKKG